MLKYIKGKAVKQLIKENKKQATKDFLECLDRKVYQAVINACNQWNGHHTRLTGDLLKIK